MRYWIQCFFILVISGLLLSCTAKKAVVQSRPTPIDEPAFQEHVARGDEFFAQSHLYGWRRAESEYESALEIRSDSDLSEKLRLTRYLILDREIDEEIYASDDKQRLTSICSGTTTPFRAMLCELAREKLRAAGVIDASPRDGEIPFHNHTALLNEHLALRAYLSLRCALASYQLAADEDPDWSSSYVEGVLSALPPARQREPLMLYVKLQQHLVNEQELFLDVFPQFAELFCARGQSMLAAERYRGGIAALERTLELVPDQTGALLQLGNLYLFALAYYSPALEYFDRVLTWDPTSVEGLFGKAVALHGLGRFRESQVVLGELLEAPDVRWTTVPAKDRAYYRSNGWESSSRPISMPGLSSNSSIPRGNGSAG